MPEWTSIADAWIAALLGPLTAWILLSGVDDLAVLGVFLWHWWRRDPRVFPGGSDPPAAPAEKPIAIFVPLWRESAVVRQMVEHNLAAIRYHNLHFFLGGYPNDEPTLAAIGDLERRHRNIHLAVCPHDGPTSKADCLNWIYQRMLLWEENHDQRFAIIVTHDAEDLIHPDSLAWLNACADHYDMVQVPVLPLPTPASELAHGVYCDDFSEYLTKDMTVRQVLGGFLPSNGVGTGFTREALEKLAAADNNCIFHPGCLTEDYENGFRLRALGCKQLFVPIRLRHGVPMATREYFPRSTRRAIRQRTRWVTGIALQGWQLHGWRGGWRQIYWHWRDRKGVIGNPASLLSNGIFAYGLATWIASLWAGAGWGLAACAPPWVSLCAPLALGLQTVQLGFRMWACQRVYGWRFAAWVPVRVLLANAINSAATIGALRQYLAARVTGRPLVWLKTEHSYPSRAALEMHKQTLGEVLVQNGYLAQRDLDEALAAKPAGVRLGEYLVAVGLLSSQHLYEALCLQQGIEVLDLEPRDVPPHVSRILPLHCVRGWKVLPFRVDEGALYLAGPRVPEDGTLRRIRRYSSLRLEFRLLPEEKFEALCEDLFPQSRRKPAASAQIRSSTSPSS